MPRSSKFGEPDPLGYVDPTKAGENIKALLEGAFDEDDDERVTRLPKRSRRQKTVSSADPSSLIDKLANLAVAGPVKTKNEAPGQNESEEVDDDEDGTVEGLNVTLLPHQVEGVAWMIDKENGKPKKNGVKPKGGILADDMGLGKTVQSIALIMTNPRPSLESQPDDPKDRLPPKEVGKSTLIVAPLALIKQWEAEVKSKVDKAHALRVLVHHGPNRAKSYRELKKFDVVVTTYQILASEHAASSPQPDGLKVGCFGVSWYRVILDEAHSIKNRNAKSTQACCDLDSWFRWCLTGTPMQNNLDELQSLINFLRIKPYDDLKQWRDQITGPMKSGRGNQAMKRVQYFLKAFMKRRTKDILKKEGALNFGKQPKSGGPPAQKMNIVARDIESVICELDTAEREFYDRLAEKANNRLQDMMSGAKQDYIGALVLLLRLRQACNHPALIQSAMANDKDALASAGLGNQSPTKKTSSTQSANDVDSLANMFDDLGMSTKKCDICQLDLDPDQVSNGAIRCAGCTKDLARDRRSRKTRTKEEARPRRQGRGKRVVLDSSEDEDEEEDKGDWLVPEDQRGELSSSKLGTASDEDAEGTGISLTATDSDTDSADESVLGPGRRKQRISSATELDTDSDSSVTSDKAPPISTSTKIRQLIKILRTEAPSHKVIVFSQFTSMLDLIEPHLAANSIRFVRYDGSMRNDAREASLASLRDNATTRVLLCSLKCGALGLNLTAASRVVIVEPFWNPFVEEQAIDRVHRLNQTVDVKVYKLTVAATVEEKIIALQDKKRELANAAIEGGKTMAKLSMKDLLSLFGHTSEMPIDVEKQWGPAKGELLGLPAGTAPQQRPSQVPQRGTIAVSSRVGEGRRHVSGGKARVDDAVYGRR